MESYTYTVGSSYRREIMIRLDELGLPYKEHRTLFDSTIVIQTFTEAQEDAYLQFAMEISNFVLQMNAMKQQRKQHELEALYKEQLKKLARKNVFRKLTFRKPLDSRPAPRLK